MTTHTGSSVTESERSITSAQLAYKLVMMLVVLLRPMDVYNV